MLLSTHIKVWWKSPPYAAYIRFLRNESSASVINLPHIITIALINPFLTPLVCFRLRGYYTRCKPIFIYLKYFFMWGGSHNTGRIRHLNWFAGYLYNGIYDGADYTCGYFREYKKAVKVNRIAPANTSREFHQTLLLITNVFY